MVIMLCFPDSSSVLSVVRQLKLNRLKPTSSVSHPRLNETVSYGGPFPGRLELIGESFEGRYESLCSVFQAQ